LKKTAVGGCESNKIIFAIFEIIWFPSSSQYVGLNVGSQFQILASCWKLCGVQKCNLAIKYDIPLLITIFEQLNSNVQAYAIAPIDGLLLKLKMKN
jgi:hypothetical protein